MEILFWFLFILVCINVLLSIFKLWLKKILGWIFVVSNMCFVYYRNVGGNYKKNIKLF